MKKLLMAVMALVLATAVFGAEADTVKNLTQEDGLKASAITLSADQTAKIQAAMGSQQPVKTSYNVYSGKTTVVVIEEQKGKWGVITLAVGISKADKKITGVEIISMSEKRGAGVKTAGYLKQYAGKSSIDPLTTGKDIKAVSGATVSSKAVTIAVKRALLVYDASEIK